MMETLERNGTGLTEMGDAPQIIPRGGFVESQAHAEVDVQISTAKRYPRSVKKFVSRATELATLDEETAQSCFYSLPRDGKNIEGPSARLAEIVAAAWTNIRAQANIVDEDGAFIVARGICWDLENNVAVSTEVRRRITNKQGRRFSDDMIGVTANAACSIALRNAVFKVIPMALVRPVYRKAREVAIGTADTLNDRRQKMVGYFGKMGVRPEQIAAKVDKAGIEDIGLDELGTLLGIATAIKEGDTSIDEQFAPLEKLAAPKKSKGDEIADSIAGGAEAPKKNGGKKSPDKPTAAPDTKSAKKTAADFVQDIEHTADAREVGFVRTDAGEAWNRNELTDDEYRQVMERAEMREATFGK